MLLFAALALGFFRLPQKSSWPPTYSFNVLKSFPHDPSAFTQGLYFEPGGTLIESTGLYGSSSIRRVDIETGQVQQIERLPHDWFGEGLTVFGDKCVQLLWREGLMILRDPQSFEIRRTLPLPRGIREGWGATTDGAGSIYVSDGTSSLHVLSADTLEVVRTVKVRAGGRELRYVNELQWVRGEVWANIYGDDRLAAIDPQSGEVRCFVDLEPILSPEERWRCHAEAVLNGLAYDAEQDRLFVTGKLWPKLYEIEVLAPDGPGGSAADQEPSDELEGAL
jgi:glutaminyl-peptide cyclotransferase